MLRNTENLFFPKLIEFMNLFCGNLEELFKKYQVYNVPTMGMDDFMVVSGMPNVVGIA